MDDFDKFHRSLFQEFRAVIMPIAEHNMEELGETLLNEILDLKRKRVIDRRRSQKEAFLANLFYGYIEIWDSYHSLKDIQVYIGRFPYTNTGISKVACLSYHIVNYMNEMYILKQRLITFLTKTGRLYKKDQLHHQVLRSTKPLFKIVKDALSRIIKTRGIHVHQSRYKDEDLERLNTIELFVRAGDVDFFEQLPDSYELECRKIRRKWKKIVKQNNETLRELFNIYFGALLKILFDESGNLIYPQAIGHT